MSKDKFRLVSKIKFTNTPFVMDIQKWFAGRTFNQQNRFQDQMSPRPGPQPNLPPGCQSALSNNYYHEHDARRLKRDPIVIDQKNLLSSGKKETTVHLAIPGKLYNPQCRVPEPLPNK